MREREVARDGMGGGWGQDGRRGCRGPGSGWTRAWRSRVGLSALSRCEVESNMSVRVRCEEKREVRTGRCEGMGHVGMEGWLMGCVRRRGQGRLAWPWMMMRIRDQRQRWDGAGQHVLVSGPFQRGDVERNGRRWKGGGRERRRDRRKEGSEDEDSESRTRVQTVEIAAPRPWLTHRFPAPRLALWVRLGGLGRVCPSMAGARVRLLQTLLGSRRSWRVGNGHGWMEGRRWGTGGDSGLEPKIESASWRRQAKPAFKLGAPGPCEWPAKPDSLLLHLDRYVQVPGTCRVDCA